MADTRTPAELEAMSAQFPGTTKISSDYGAKEEFRKSAHEGVDFAMPEGTKVNNVSAGTVQDVVYQPATGWMVKMLGDDRSTQRYMHLKQEPTHIKRGDRLKAGSFLGLSGATGEGVTGPHLHYGTMRGGKAQDPGAQIEAEQIWQNYKKEIESFSVDEKEEHWKKFLTRNLGGPTKYEVAGPRYDEKKDEAKEKLLATTWGEYPRDVPKKKPEFPAIGFAETVPSGKPGVPGMGIITGDEMLPEGYDPEDYQDPESPFHPSKYLDPEDYLDNSVEAIKEKAGKGIRLNVADLSYVANVLEQSPESFAAPEWPGLGQMPKDKGARSAYIEELRKDTAIAGSIVQQARNFITSVPPRRWKTKKKIVTPEDVEREKAVAAAREAAKKEIELARLKSELIWDLPPGLDTAASDIITSRQRYDEARKLQTDHFDGGRELLEKTHANIAKHRKEQETLDFALAMEESSLASTRLNVQERARILNKDARDKALAEEKEIEPLRERLFVRALEMPDPGLNLFGATRVRLKKRTKEQEEAGTPFEVEEEGFEFSGARTAATLGSVLALVVNAAANIASEGKVPLFVMDLIKLAMGQDLAAQKAAIIKVGGDLSKVDTAWSNIYARLGDTRASNQEWERTNLAVLAEKVNKVSADIKFATAESRKALKILESELTIEKDKRERAAHIERVKMHMNDVTVTAGANEAANRIAASQHQMNIARLSLRRDAGAKKRLTKYDSQVFNGTATLMSEINIAIELIERMEKKGAPLASMAFNQSDLMEWVEPKDAALLNRIGQQVARRVARLWDNKVAVADAEFWGQHSFSGVKNLQVLLLRAKHLRQMTGISMALNYNALSPELRERVALHMKQAGMNPRTVLQEMDSDSIPKFYKVSKNIVNSLLAFHDYGNAEWEEFVPTYYQGSEDTASRWDTRYSLPLVVSGGEGS